MNQIDFVKKFVVEDIFKNYDSGMEEDDFKQGTQHDIMTDEGKMRIKSSILKTIEDEYDYRKYEYRMIVAKIETLKQLKRKLIAVSDETDLFDNEIKQLSDDLIVKYREYRLSEQLLLMFDN